MKYFFILVFYFTINISYSQTNISGVINSYTLVTGLTQSGCSDSITVNSTVGFLSGDSVLIIQMQGAIVDSSNTSAFGTITSYEKSGNFEFLKIASINGNNIRFTSTIKRNYSVNGNVQLVTKPIYTNAIVTGILTAQSWNGITGGILTFSVTNNLTLNSDIDVSGLGYRGGSPSSNYYIGWSSDFCFGALPGRGGKKGESIVPYFTNLEYGRGAQASGGGGGNDINTGAAGGGNFGSGGHGGNNFFAPDTLWGIAGKSLAPGINQNKIFLGGGGGGGHQNNSQGTSGSNGGGMIFIYANNLTGNNQFIKANGLDVTIVAGIDGAGGGGAGGSILMDVPNYFGNLNIETKGGKGGDQNYPPQCHGNGGGGGGGVILHSGVSLPANVLTFINGGVQGVGQCNNSVNDAAIGDSGEVIPYTIPQSVIIADAGSDTTICPGEQAHIGTSPQPGLIYQWDNGDVMSQKTVSPIQSTSYILSVSDGVCNFSYDTVDVFVTPQPSSSFNYSINCNTINLSNASAFSSCLWYFGDSDSSSLTNPIHTFSDTGSYLVSLVVYNSIGCKDSSSQYIQIATQTPQSIFTVNPQSCSSTALSIINNSLNAFSYYWDFGDGNSDTIKNPYHVYNLPGQYNVTLISINLCHTDSLTTSVVIDTAITINFSSVLDTCTSNVSFNTNTSQINNTLWNFGDGSISTVQNPFHNYINSGYYSVNLISVLNSGCIDTSYINVIIPPNPLAGIGYIYNPCTPSVHLLNQSLNSTFSEWHFGDGDSSNNFNADHIFASAGDYSVLLVATSMYGCKDSIWQELSIAPPAKADFDIHIDTCSDVVLFNNKSPFAASYNWDFGDNTFSTIEDPIHHYESEGSYTVELTVNKGTLCPDIINKKLNFITGNSLIFIPNSFTPNGDGINDEFQIISKKTCNAYSLIIFNRWGESIFKTDDPINETWKGLYNGQNVEEGIYVYLLKGSNSQKTGHIVLLR